MLIRVRWIPFLLGLGLLVDATQGKWIDKQHPAPVLIVVEVLLGLVCLAWAWWLRQRRLQREALFVVQQQWAAYGQAQYAEDHGLADLSDGESGGDAQLSPPSPD
jgi:hypothetical protein